MQKIITVRVKWLPKYKKAMDLVELWVLLKTRYEKYFYNVRRLTHIQRQFPHITPKFNETEIKTGIQSAYSGNKVVKNQAEALKIEYRTNPAYSLEEEGKGPASTNIRNIQRREEDHTRARRIKYIEGKFRKPGTTFVTQQQTNGSTLKNIEKNHWRKL